ncbi:MAG: ABC transporter permease [Clostridiales bacterium]|nr:ABC transporter permease [Clostridiales bacterium]
MKSVTSCFNKALFIKNIKRFWPVWALYNIAWVIGMPLVIVSQLSSSFFGNASYINNYIMNNALYMGVIMNAIFGFVSALTLFSYLYNARSAGAFHTLPIRREGLFLTCFLSGLCWLFISNLFIFALSAGIELLYGSLSIGYLLQWLAMVCLQGLFFYGFAVFCAFLTGHGFALLVIYGILNFIVAIVELIIRFCASLFCYGLTSVSSTTLDVLSPIVMLFKNTSIEGYYDGSRYLDPVYTGWTTLLIYAAAGLVFTALALLLYRRRHSESASEFIAVPTLRPFFQYFFAFIGSLVLGILFYSVIFGFSSYDESGSAWPMLSCMIVGGFLGYFITAMLLRKSFRVFKKTTPGFLVYVVALAALVMAMELDVFKVERYIPDVNSVETLRIYGSSETLFFDDPEVIEELMLAHKAIIENKPANEKYARSGSRIYSDMFHIDYRYSLKNGKTISRRYDLYNVPGADKDILLMLEERFNTPGAVSDRMSDILEIDENSISSVGIYYLDHETPEAKVNEEYLTGSDAREFLQDCIKADIRAGKLGRTFIFYDMGSENALYDCFIKINFAGGVDYITVLPNLSSEKTISYLKKMGIEPAVAEYPDRVPYMDMEYRMDMEYSKYGY